MSPYNQYTGSKPPPLWLKAGGTIIMVCAMAVYAVGGFIKLAITR
jgi:hypothetical protein